MRRRTSRPRRAPFTPVLALVAVFTAACSSGSQDTVRPLPPPDSASYRNPVLDVDFPDPSVLRAPDGWFYAYATQTIRGGRRVNIQVARSRELVSWELLGDALPRRPAWSTRVWNFWAPHVVYDATAQRYLMYYSAHDDALDGKCVAVAVSGTPRGPFVDTGTPLVCGRDGFNIDPMAFDDPVTGRRFLYWGSSASRAIQVQELAPDRVSFATGSVPQPVVQPGLDRDYARLVEGLWVIYRDGYYYAFYSGDDCCGSPPHYAVLVARARDPLGPFERLGQVTTTGRGEILAGGSWGAPGHIAIITDDAGADWIVYHAVDPARPLQDEAAFVRRPMLIDRLLYRGGWPVVENGEPSTGLTARPSILLPTTF